MVFRLRPGFSPSTMPYRFRITGMHITDLIKFVLAAGFGFALRTFIGMPCTETHCPTCPDCSQLLAEQELLKADLHFQLREPFKPKTMYEVLRYDHFTMSHIINNFDDDPKIGLLGHQKSDIKDIIHQAMALYNSGRPDRWKMLNLTNGYRRVDPLRGEEFMLDAVIAQEENSKVTETHRFEMVKPFGVAQLLNDKTSSSQKMVHFILPISGISKRFEIFMKNFEEVCLKQSNEHAYLLIVLFVGKTNSDQTQADNLKAMARVLTNKYRNAHIRIIQTHREFSRALGLDLGAKQLPTDSLIFFCDADVQFTAEALDRCRLNAEEGKQVYYPIVFAQYSPDVVKKYSPADRVKNLMDINKYTGHWVHYGFGMACMYNLDYRSVGGFNTQIQGWGGEDVDLYIRHVKSPLQVFRAMDPGLIHIFHNKTCSPNLGPDQTRMCVDSQAEGIGSRQQLAKILVDRDRKKA